MKKPTIGQRLKAYRDRSGVSQVDLANRLGISNTFLHDLERDRRPIGVRVAIAIEKAVGWNARTLLRGQLDERLAAEGYKGGNVK